jgi:hypothetical protein
MTEIAPDFEAFIRAWTAARIGPLGDRTRETANIGSGTRLPRGTRTNLRPERSKTRGDNCSAWPRFTADIPTAEGRGEVNAIVGTNRTCV